MTPHPRRALAGRHILLTGATGFVAKVWLSLVLDQIPDIGRVSVLVRPRSRRETAQERFEAILDTSPVMRPLRETHGANLARFLGARLQVLSGDIEKPLLGLAPDRLEALAERVNLVIHCAGITDFQPDPAKALRVNIFGARHAAQLARRLEVPLVHMSTAFVAGAVSGTVHETLEPGVAPDGTSFDVRAEVRALQQLCREGEGARKVAVRTEAATERARALGWPNLYTYTKGLAEHLVATTRGVQWTIVRPSIVECAQRFPFPGWNEGLNTAGPLAWLITTPFFRRLPTRPEHNFDIVPVDEVARGLTCIAAAAIRGEAGGVFHLASSDVNPLRFGRTVELTGLAMRRWTRKGGGTTLDRTLARHLDPVPVDQHAQGPFAPDRLRAFAAGLREALGRFDAEQHLPPGWATGPAGQALTRWVAAARVKTISADQTLSQVEQMLALFKPFIHDHDYVFRTDRIRALAPEAEPDFGWEVPSIDWRYYWVDIEYPGLQTWSIPVLRGEAIPRDPPSSPPLRLGDVVLEDRARDQQGVA